MAVIDVKVRFDVGDIDVDQARWEAFARDPSGPIARDMRRRADNVSDAMVVPENTGLLESTKRVEEDNSGRLPSASVVVGREGLTPYLGYVLEGTKPHVIRSRPGGPTLRFIQGGQTVFRRSVNHPGTRANDFMNAALPAALT